MRCAICNDKDLPVGIVIKGRAVGPATNPTPAIHGYACTGNGHYFMAHTDKDCSEVSDIEIVYLGYNIAYNYSTGILLTIDSWWNEESEILFKVDDFESKSDNEIVEIINKEAISKIRELKHFI